MLALLRSLCKKSYFAQQQERHGDIPISNRRILLTRPTVLSYEKYVFDYYMQICKFVLSQLDRVSTLQ